MGWRSSGVVCVVRYVFSPRSANAYCGRNTRGVLCMLECFTTSRKNSVNVPLIEVNEELYVVKGNV
jgi:hypothetical protein